MMKAEEGVPRFKGEKDSMPGIGDHKVRITNLVLCKITNSLTNLKWIDYTQEYTLG